MIDYGHLVSLINDKKTAAAIKCCDVLRDEHQATLLQVGALARALADIHREVVIHDLSPNTPKVVRTLASEAIAALAKAGFSVESALTRDHERGICDEKTCPKCAAFKTQEQSDKRIRDRRRNEKDHG